MVIRRSATFITIYVLWLLVGFINVVLNIASGNSIAAVLWGIMCLLLIPQVAYFVITDYVKIFEDHVIIYNNFITGKLFCIFSDIAAITYEKTKIIMLLKEGKKIIINTSSIQKSDRGVLEELLKKKYK